MYIMGESGLGRLTGNQWLMANSIVVAPGIGGNLRIQCPGCKKSITLTNSQITNRQTRITCPSCRKPITIQSSVKADADKAKKQLASMLKKIR